MKVALGAQNSEVGVMHVEKGLKIGENVARRELSRIVGRQRHVVASRGGHEKL